MKNKTRVSKNSAGRSKPVRKRRKRKKTIKISRQSRILMLAAAIILISLIIYFQRDITEQGRLYLSSQSSLNAADIADELKVRKQNDLQYLIESGQADPLAAFNDFVVLGDSRPVGFAAVGAMDSSRVLANAGDTVLAVANSVETVKELQPSKIILSYGVNDMGMEVGKDSGGYAAEYERQVDSLLEVDPNAEIYICSIIDVTDAAKEYAPAWSKAAEWNQQLYELCQRRGWTYIDCDQLSVQPEEYVSDGVHFMPDFYLRWAKFIGTQILSHELGSESAVS